MNETILRNADLRTLADTLKAEQATKHDVIVSERLIDFTLAETGEVLAVVPEVMEGTDIRIDTPCKLTGNAVSQLAARLGIPGDYLRKMLATPHGTLAIANLKHWAERSDKKAMLRAFFDGEGGGTLRAVLSDRYKSIDHLDAFFATLEGFRAAGIKPTHSVANLTDGRLDVRFTSEDIAINIADLVADYRYGDRHGRDYPMLYAGFALRNSETGSGAYSLVPMVVEQVCTNGMTRVTDAYRAVHLGERLEEGVIEWSNDTIQKQLDVITAKTRDVVRATLNTDWLEKVANEMREAKGIAITKPAETIKAVGKTMRWSEAQQDSILASFIVGGDVSALGLAQAVTAVAQAAPTGEAQADAEDSVWAVVAATRTAVRTLG